MDTKINGIMNNVVVLFTMMKIKKDLNFHTRGTLCCV